MRTLSGAEESPAAALSQGQEARAARLSQWLQLMLAEIARKRDELERAHAEQTLRAVEQAQAPAPDAVQRTPPRR